MCMFGGQYEWFSVCRNLHDLIPWSHICLYVYKIACLSLYVITVENIMQWCTNMWTSNLPLYEGSDRFRSSIQQLGMNMWMYQKRIFVFNCCGMHIMCFSKIPSWIRNNIRHFWCQQLDGWGKSTHLNSLKLWNTVFYKTANPQYLLGLFSWRILWNVKLQCTKLRPCRQN